MMSNNSKWMLYVSLVGGMLATIGSMCATFGTGAPMDDLIPRGKPSAEQTELLKIFLSEFVNITPGEGKFPASFVMGEPNDVDQATDKDQIDVNASPVEPRNVKMAHTFAIGCYEVPQNLYETVMGHNPSRWKGPRNSVELMTIAEAQKFCQRTTALLHSLNLITGEEEIRLPSEIEWEYCCRAGTTTRYSFGDSATKPGDKGPQASHLSLYSWHTGNAAGNDPPVGALKPNPWGLYDMHGYLWEFVASDEIVPADSAKKESDDGDVSKEKPAQIIIRGGSWRDHYSMHTSSYRRSLPADMRGDAIGFRCVKAHVDN